MTKTLVLIRHGHRDATRRELNNGLDNKGKEQAKAIRRFFVDRFEGYDFKKGLWLVSSPKLRCMETLAPLGKAVERSVDAHPGLDEQGSKETRTVFEARVSAFVKEWKGSSAPLTVLSSHGDWLPLGLMELAGLTVELKKGSWTELEIVDGRTSLKWYIPTFKHFYGF